MPPRTVCPARAATATRRAAAERDPATTRPGHTVLGGMIGTVAGPLFQALADVMGAVTAWFVTHIIDGISHFTTPKFDGAWWSRLYNRQVAVAAVVALVLLLLAAAHGAIRGDGRSLGKAVSGVALWGPVSDTH